MYSQIKRGNPQLKLSPHPEWKFYRGAGSMSFRHLERDSAVHSWQGSEICSLFFDELTHFSSFVFFYMLSRNRSTCGVKPYVRATCNPDADSWVAEFIAWWIDQDTGYPIPERSGVIRWFVRIDEQLYWGETKAELIEQFADIDGIEDMPKSLTFISSKVTDNFALMECDPGYMANLKALALVERERLLFGNWKIKPAAGLYFRRSQIRNFIEVIPADVMWWVRGWDLAATTEKENKESALTASVLIGKRRDGSYIVADVTNERLSPAEVRARMRQKAQQDRAKFKSVHISIPQDPGQAGKDQAQSLVKLLSGFNVKTSPESGSKLTRAEPMAAQWQAGNFDILIADWNDAYIEQLESFPESKFKDMVDAGSRSFNEIESIKVLNLDALT
jgi:predicted phage terminase large subunit-like protein